MLTCDSKYLNHTAAHSAIGNQATQ